MCEQCHFGRLYPATGLLILLIGAMNHSCRPNTEHVLPREADRSVGVVLMVGTSDLEHHPTLPASPRASSSVLFYPTFSSSFLTRKKKIPQTLLLYPSTDPCITHSRYVLSHLPATLPSLPLVERPPVAQLLTRHRRHETPTKNKSPIPTDTMPGFSQATDLAAWKALTEHHDK